MEASGQDVHCPARNLDDISSVYPGLHSMPEKDSVLVSLKNNT
jgi:hypothetical protein